MRSVLKYHERKLVATSGAPSARVYIWATLFLGGNKYGNPELGSAGLRPEKICASDAQQDLKTIDPTSRQIGRPT
jgi:hypothetical protein